MSSKNRHIKISNHAMERLEERFPSLHPNDYEKTAIGCMRHGMSMKQFKNEYPELWKVVRKANSFTKYKYYKQLFYYKDYIWVFTYARTPMLITLYVPKLEEIENDTLHNPSCSDNEEEFTEDPIQEMQRQTDTIHYAFDPILQL